MGGRQAVVKETKPVNSRRYVATFDVENTTKGDSGRYRCIAQSERGVGVSSYSDLTVKRKSWLAEIFLFSYFCLFVLMWMCLILFLFLMFIYILLFIFFLLVSAFDR